MSHLDCEFLTMLKKGKVVKEEWQHVPTSYCRIQRFSLTTKEKTITQKWNMYYSLADLRYALTVGRVLLSHMLWIASRFLYKRLFTAVMYLCREGLVALQIRLSIRKTPQRSSWQMRDMQKESESRFLPCTRAWDQMWSVLLCPPQSIRNNKNKCKASAVLKTSECLNKKIAKNNVPNSILLVQLHWCARDTKSDTRRLAQCRWDPEHHKKERLWFFHIERLMRDSCHFRWQAKKQME